MKTVKRYTRRVTQAARSRTGQVSETFRRAFEMYRRDPALDRPIFVWGAPRSGTTLLYELTGQHPDVAYPVNSDGRPLEGTKYWWDAFGEHRGEMPDEAFRQSQVQQIRIAYRDLVHRSGKTRLLDKVVFLSLWIPLVNRAFPDARHIHIIRDGRAVVNSVLHKLRYSDAEKDRVFVTGQVLYGPLPPGLSDPLSQPPARRHARQWQLLVEHGRRNAELLEDRYLEVRYEDLTADPRGVMRVVLDHAQLDYDERFISDNYPERLQNRNTKWSSDSQASDGYTKRRAIEPDDWPHLDAMMPYLRALGYED